MITACPSAALFRRALRDDVRGALAAALAATTGLNPGGPLYAATAGLVAVADTSLDTS